MATVLLLGGFQAGCEDPPTTPDMLRFGQIGEARLHVIVPLGVEGDGELQQIVTWNSAGLWQLTESISYLGLVGDDNTRRSTLNPEVLAGIYAQWVTQINDVQGLQLFGGELDPGLDPTCGELRTRVTLHIRDEARDQEMSWTRCGSGTLATLTPADAGPDLNAGRLMAAASLLRFYTLGDDFLSAYHASFPFGTLARRDDSPKAVFNPRIIRTDSALSEFWREHLEPARPPPVVDFEQDMVLVAAVGVRTEAGDSVEVRRVLPVDLGTFVEQVLRIPGDFCSPASGRHTPFHVVVTPAVPEPVQFQEARVERVPCGR